MALAAAGSYASFDVTARTEGRSIDSILWDALWAKSRVLEVIGKGPQIKQQRHEWMSLAAPTVFVTDTTDSGADEVADGAATTILNVASGEGVKVPVGAFLVNATRATPIGTYQRNELLQVTGVSTDALTVVRDAGAFNSGTGYASHVAGDKYRVLYSLRNEGSKATDDPNLYKSRTILENYAAIQAIKLEATGSQLARDMEIVANDLERQYQRELLQLKNETVGMVLYGFNSATAVGSDTVYRNCKGLQDFMVDNISSTNPLVDYATQSLSADALNALFLRLWNNGADPSEGFKILTSGVSHQVISSWESDKVRTTWQEGRVGRYVTEFVSDLGFTAEIISDPLIAKSDLFIINPEKIKVIPFRPFEKQEWGKGTSAPNGDDIYYQRTIGEHTLEVVDPGTAHAGMTYLTWL
jgi:hypothetical protein